MMINKYRCASMTAIPLADKINIQVRKYFPMDTCIESIKQKKHKTFVQILYVDVSGYSNCIKALSLP